MSSKHLWCRSVVYSYSAETDVEAAILTAVATVSGITSAHFTATSSDNKTSVTVTVNNAFSGACESASSKGLTGSVKLLAAPELLISSDHHSNNNNNSIASAAVMESWMHSAEQTLLPIIRGNKKTAFFQSAVLEFAQHLENHLFQKNQTVLVGECLSAADIVVAVCFAAACQTCSIQSGSVPEQAYRYVQTVLSRLAECVMPAEKKLILSYAAAFKEGTASSLEKGTEKAVPASSSSADAAAAASKTAKEASTTATTTGNSDENAILKLLDEFGLQYEAYEHTACTTAEELVANVPLPDPSETHTKNLFLRDKKHGLFLVTTTPDAVVNTKELGKMLNLQGKTNLRLADEKLLDEKLHVKPGCVGPLCIGLANNNDSNKGDETVTLVMDENLLKKYKFIHSHPLRNDMSVKLTPQMLQSFLGKVNVEPVFLQFESAAADVLPGKVPANRPPATKTAPAAEKKKPQKPPEAKADKKTAEKGKTLLGLQWKKTENFANWYTDVIVLSEMISYYDVSGCYILRPWSYKMWELIQNWFNEQIEIMGVENSYFPLFVSQDRLEKEKDHVEGFAPEVAWVTRSGETDLAKPIAIRPTSETIMYPAFSDWIKSHRDLPLKLNQWSNVVRWEFKYPTPFLRTREFLWQEGHTAHASFEDADDTVMKALDLYRGVYEDLLAVPVIPGYKTEKEKFAGGFRTTTVEAYIAGSGRAIQGATSHNLGQNFGKMFDISYQDEQGKSAIAWQTSWGLTTRTIGVMVMVHGDDTGLVLPPRVAPLQVVIVSIVSKKFSEEQADPYCLSILEDLKKAGVRAKYDNRSMYNPGWKYNHWEQKGVPIRVEVGPRDVEQKSARIVIRHNGDKEDHSVEGLGELLVNKLNEIQSAMFAKAKEARDSHIVQVKEWKDFVPNLEKNNLVLTPWCGGEHQDWEEWVKTKSREESLQARGEEVEDDKTATSVAAKTLCIPFKQPELPAGTKCIASGKDATCWVLWGRSY